MSNGPSNRFPAIVLATKGAEADKKDTRADAKSGQKVHAKLSISDTKKYYPSAYDQAFSSNSVWVDDSPVSSRDIFDIVARHERTMSAMRVNQNYRQDGQAIKYSAVLSTDASLNTFVHFAPKSNRGKLRTDHLNKETPLSNAKWSLEYGEAWSICNRTPFHVEIPYLENTMEIYLDLKTDTNPAVSELESKARITVPLHALQEEVQTVYKLKKTDGTVLRLKPGDSATMVYWPTESTTLKLTVEMYDALPSLHSSFTLPLHVKKYRSPADQKVLTLVPKGTPLIQGGTRRVYESISSDYEVTRGDATTLLEFENRAQASDGYEVNEYGMYIAKPEILVVQTMARQLKSSEFTYKVPVRGWWAQWLSNEVGGFVKDPLHLSLGLTEVQPDAPATAVTISIALEDIASPTFDKDILDTFAQFHSFTVEKAKVVYLKDHIEELYVADIQGEPQEFPWMMGHDKKSLSCTFRVPEGAGTTVISTRIFLPPKWNWLFWHSEVLKYLKVTLQEVGTNYYQIVSLVPQGAFSSGIKAPAGVDKSFLTTTSPRWVVADEYSPPDENTTKAPVKVGEGCCNVM